MQIKVKARLELGQTIPVEHFLSMDSLLPTTTGGKLCKEYPESCSRCGSRTVHLWREGDYYVCFCATDSCLQEDVTASKAIAREKARNEKERNNFGQVITGAEKFDMGSLFKHATLAKWTGEQAYSEKINLWLKSSSPFLIVSGSAGTGKTYLCAAILNQLHEQKKEVYYTTHRRLMSYVQKSFNENKTQQETLNKISYKDYFIFDDLGSATNTEWQKEIILELIDTRYNREAKTLITSNFNKKEMFDVFGERTASRIYDKKNIIIDYTTGDRRQLED